jgi:hypothetical protein
VAFTYDDFSSKSLPTNPLVYRVRTDITWENVLASEEEIAPTRGTHLFVFVSSMFFVSFLFIHLVSPNFLYTVTKQSEFPSHPIRLWGDKKSKSARKILEKIMRRKGLDPLLPDTWYFIDVASLLVHKVHLPSLLRKSLFTHSFSPPFLPPLPLNFWSV